MAQAPGLLFILDKTPTRNDKAAKQWITSWQESAPAEAKVREVLLKGKAQYGSPPFTNLFRIANS
jgi:hypothetical protein